MQNETISVSEKSCYMYYILLYLFSLLGTTPSITFIKKREWYPLVILNNDLLYSVTDRSCYQKF